jgi:hypothetical protein
MRASHLLFTGICVGAAITYALLYEPTLQSEARFDAVDDPDKLAAAMED